MTDDCIDCDDKDGTCEWTGCGFEADYAIRDVTVNRGGALLNVGDVNLCGGHKRRAQRLGRLELDWERVLKAAS